MVRSTRPRTKTRLRWCVQISTRQTRTRMARAIRCPSTKKPLPKVAEYSHKNCPHVARNAQPWARIPTQFQSKEDAFYDQQLLRAAGRTCAGSASARAAKRLRRVPANE